MYVIAGGGLARIVGTMTAVPSVSISPPGLSMSFKKYNFLGAEIGTGMNNKVKHIPSYMGTISEQGLHHESFAVISEYDW